MTTPTYPSSLPNVRMQGYGFRPGNPNIRTDMESGFARVRRRFLNAPTEMKVSWSFTLAELGIFEKFYEQDLSAGSAWFYINLVNGAGETQYLARFTESYDVKTEAKEFVWTVTATLETLTKPLLS